MNKVSTNHSVIQLFSYSVIRATRKGFTLVELLVVIGIIGILSGVLLATFGKSTEAARAAKCLVNMRSLANAATAFSMEKGQWYYYTQNKEGQLGYYPSAGSVSGGKTGNYQEYVGWISWLSEGEFKSGGITEPKYGNTIKNCPYFGTGDIDKDRWALEHGALWRAIGQTKEPYVCPTHAHKCSKEGRNPPLFSYVMNMKFGCDFTDGADYVHTNPDEIPLDIGVPKNGSLARPDRVLMFAEIAGSVNDKEDGKNQTASSETCSPICDCVLQYNASVNGKKLGGKWKGKSEPMGFPHLGASGKLCGHVAFADGHVEKFLKPKGAGGALSQEELTAALCEGLDVIQNGSEYRALENEGATY